MAESGHSGHSGQESGPVSATSWTGHWDSPFVDPEMEEIMTSLILGETARQEQGDHEMDVCFGDPETESKLHRQRCEKNPGHKNFIAVRDLNPGHLPAPYNFQGFVDWVKFVATLTVRLFIRYTSANRPDSLGLTNLKG
ncbi:uncharacterized protein LOC106012044 [Aplysia californica]|uniref:Uncharacterized protein LOC106012044 n=1 Tax=Aplysia californica TaxID=6500 RepID=A0ABM1A1X6_APLCA|nr:uncharacterized protein LOC106012044 [Aplysia californica]